MKRLLLICLLLAGVEANAIYIGSGGGGTVDLSNVDTVASFNAGIKLGPAVSTASQMVYADGNTVYFEAPDGSKVNLGAGASGGEANTLGTAGAGVTLNAVQSSTELRVKTIAAGTGISLDNGATNVTLNVTLNSVNTANIAVTANALSGFVGLPCEIQVAVGSQSTAMVATTNVMVFRMPFAMTVTSVRASVKTAPTGAIAIFDINEGGTTILSTKLSIDATEKTSVTAATAAVISDASLADDAEITIDIDQIGSTIAGTGPVITLKGTRQ